MHVDAHPLLRAAVFTTTLPAPLATSQSPAWLTALLAADAEAPMTRDEDARAAIRDMLRHGGYKPTGRGKPASEYLVRASGEGALQPINLVVDACNAVSLHSGLPISVIDIDRATPPFRIGVAPPDSSYVFNASGHEIDLAGLLCVFDADGPCGNAVKDSQRTKTHDGTTRTLSVIWGTVGHEERLKQATLWYQDIL
ncbi:MAG: phenylalanine--tRNA ligase beta subunit-related protein, partial [Longimicrobiales bacterium]